MENNFNQLTPAEAERLAMLAEEAAEVIQVIGKILRHGYESSHPNRVTTNREDLQSEIADFQNVCWAMEGSGDIDKDKIEWAAKRSFLRKARYTHHQEEWKDDG